MNQEQNKEIKEIANIVRGTECKGNCDKCGKCVEYNTAVDLYNAGYRKVDDTGDFTTYGFKSGQVKALIEKDEEIRKLKEEIKMLRNSIADVIRSFSRMDTFYKLKCNELETAKQNVAKEIGGKISDEVANYLRRTNFDGHTDNVIDHFELCEIIDKVVKEYKI